MQRDARAEFLEGIDIRDPEWEDWLRNQRLRDASDDGEDPRSLTQTLQRPVRTEDAVVKNPFALSITVDRGSGNDGLFLGGVLADTLARNMSDATGVEVRLCQETDAGMTLNVSHRQMQTNGGIQLSLRHGRTGKHIWSSGRMFAGKTSPCLDNHEIVSLQIEAQEAAISGHLSQLPQFLTKPDDIVQTQLAARKIFTYDAQQLREAEKMLDDICHSAVSAIAIGWLLIANRVMLFERVVTATPDRLESLEMRCVQALELAPTNAFVLAAISGMYLRFLDRQSQAIALAQRAVRLNPTSPFALDALASAMYVCGRNEEGYRLSRRVRNLTINTQNAHFFEMSLCVAAILTGRNDEALKMANSAVAQAPKFRAAWRYAIALNANARNFKGAAQASRRLASIEPGFTIDQYINDPKYPIWALRSASIPLAGLQEILT